MPDGPAARPSPIPCFDEEVRPHPVVVGTLVGASFGLVFVLVNAGPLPATTAWRTLGVLASAAVVVLLLRLRVPRPPQPARGAARVYALSVAAEVVAIPLGARVLGALDRSDLVLPWVVLVVGVHFWPFARAFHAPVFRWLAVALVAPALAGGAAVLADVPEAGPASGVAAGFVLVLGVGAALVVGARTPAQPGPGSAS